MNELYLRKEKGEFYIYLLGKNGEPKSSVNVNVRFAHPHLIDNNDMKKIVLKTDKEGKVKLGHLKKIVGLTAEVTLFNLNRHFVLNQVSQNFTYPN